MSSPKLPAHLSIFYRGKLSSCNYDCAYCPFAKTYDTRAALATDAKDLRRFIAWAGAQTFEISVLFTPWGEGLVRKHYRDGLAQLSRYPHLRRVAIQTNLCVGTRWLDSVDRDKLALWCTYHPTQVSRGAFLNRCAELSRRQIRYSVGVVAMQEHLEEIGVIRAALPAAVPLWINAYDQGAPDYYSDAQIERLQQIDPYFHYNLNPNPSLGAPCSAGEHMLSVDGNGNATRCHFVKTPMGNLYDGSYAAQLKPRSCPNACCDCYIGYAQRKDLPFQREFSDGLLARIPSLNGTG